MEPPIGIPMRWIAMAALVACGAAGAVTAGWAAREPELTAAATFEKKPMTTGGAGRLGQIPSRIWAGHK